MTSRAIQILAAVLLATSCSSGDEPAVSPDTSAAANPQVETTTSTAESTTSSASAPLDASGIWVTDFAGSILQFRLEAGPGGALTGFFDSVSEGVTDLPISVSVEDAAVSIEIPVAQAVFAGEVDGDTFSGTWTQAATDVPMTFTRQAEPVVLSRPQDPQPPFPYKATDVAFANDDVTLAGTLLVPDGAGPFPAAVLISGSGAQDRDESLLGHKPFLVIADSLARQGIATLRFDDRGVGGSTGNPVGATTADLAGDAAAAVEFLTTQPEINTIGLIGHSEGGLIAPIVALDSPAVSFVVLLAGPGLPGAQVLLTQTEELMRAEGAPEATIEWRLGWNEEVIALSASDASDLEVAQGIEELLTSAGADAPASMQGLVTDAGIEDVSGAFTDPWMRFFLAYDPAPALRDLEVPVFAMIGELDLQVSAAENIPALETALATNSDATTLALPGLNHLFQHATTGSVSEYAQIDETFDPATLQAMADWIQERS